MLWEANRSFTNLMAVTVGGANVNSGSPIAVDLGDINTAMFDHTYHLIELKQTPNVQFQPRPSAT